MKFKITSLKDGSDVGPNGFVIDAETGEVMRIAGGDKIQFDAGTSAIFARPFTGKTDCLGTNVYADDVLLYEGKRYMVDYCPQAAAFFCVDDQGELPPDGDDISGLIHEGYVVVWNRWQPEFKGVFR